MNFSLFRWNTPSKHHTYQHTTYYHGTSWYYRLQIDVYLLLKKNFIRWPPDWLTGLIETNMRFFYQAEHFHYFHHIPNPFTFNRHGRGSNHCSPIHSSPSYLQHNQGSIHIYICRLFLWLHLTLWQIPLPFRPFHKSGHNCLFLLLIAGMELAECLTVPPHKQISIHLCTSSQRWRRLESVICSICSIFRWLLWMYSGTQHKQTGRRLPTIDPRSGTDRPSPWKTNLFLTWRSFNRD